MMVGACHLLWVVVTRDLSPSVAGGHLWPVVVCGLWVLVVGEIGLREKKKGKHVLVQKPVHHHQRSNRHLKLTPRSCGCEPIPFFQPMYVMQR